MGLDTTHDCWHGPYSSFGEWRRKVAAAVGINLDDMQGYGGSKPWSNSDPIEFLLNHSDCDGEIAWQDAEPLADRLEVLLPDLSPQPAYMYEFSPRGRAQTFIRGLRVAFEAKESVGFH